MGKALCFVWRLAFVALLSVFAASSWAQGQTKAEQGTGANWEYYGGTQSSWRYSLLDQINTTNIKKLAPAWIFQTGDYQEALQATPMVVDGRVFLSTARSYVYALDGTTGQLLWQYKYQPGPGFTGAGLTQNRGVAVADGKVYLGTYDDFLIALDQKTGREIWKVAVDDPASCRCNISGAPLIVKNMVVVGNGGEAGRRGYLAAFNLQTGRQLWRFYTIPRPGEPGGSTWRGDSWKYGGGSPWMTGSYDPDLNLLYWGVGNADPIFNGTLRPGENLYGNSVVALNADTGKLRWYYQEVPHDTWDYDANWEPVLMNREINGKMRKLMVHFGKGGYTWVLDRENGKLVGTYQVPDTVNWITGISPTGELLGRRDVIEGQPPPLICPSNLGGKNWNHTAYSPKTGLIYSPTLEMCNDLVLQHGEGGPNSRGGGTWVFKPPPGHDTAYAHIDALDPVTGKKAWTFPVKFELMSSMLATAGDLVFTGDPEGNYFALDARDGKKLWSFQTGAGHRGSAVTYSVGGRQFIAVPTGWGSIAARITSGLWPEASTWRMGSTLVVFALPEDSK